MPKTGVAELSVVLVAVERGGGGADVDFVRAVGSLRVRCRRVVSGRGAACDQFGAGRRVRTPVVRLAFGVAVAGGVALAATKEWLEDGARAANLGSTRRWEQSAVADVEVATRGG
jgi:hypothetical protein